LYEIFIEWNFNWKGKNKDKKANAKDALKNSECENV